VLFVLERIGVGRLREHFKEGLREPQADDRKTQVEFQRQMQEQIATGAANRSFLTP
jgi:hypothetical protein